MGITPRQAECLDFVREYMDEMNGVAPSLEEIRVAMGLKTKSGAYRHLSKLEENGYIRRQPYVIRSIEVCAPDALDIAHKHVLWALTQGISMGDVMESIFRPRTSDLKQAVIEVALVWQDLEE